MTLMFAWGPERVTDHYGQDLSFPMKNWNVNVLKLASSRLKSALGHGEFSESSRQKNF